MKGYSILAFVFVLSFAWCNTKKVGSTSASIPVFTSEADMYKRILGLPNVQIHPLPDLAFKHTRFERVVIQLRTHPMVYYFSRNENGRILNLTGNRLKFIAAAIEDGMEIQTPQEAENYQILAFEATKQLGAYPVNSLQNFKYFETLLEKENAKCKMLLSRYEKAYFPLHAIRNDNGFEVNFCFIYDQQLFHRIVQMNMEGYWTEQDLLLEESLPSRYVQ